MSLINFNSLYNKLQQDMGSKRTTETTKKTEVEGEKAAEKNSATKNIQTSSTDNDSSSIESKIKKLKAEIESISEGINNLQQTHYTSERGSIQYRTLDRAINQLQIILNEKKASLTELEKQQEEQKQEQPLFRQASELILSLGVKNITLSDKLQKISIEKTSVETETNEQPEYSTVRQDIGEEDNEEVQQPQTKETIVGSGSWNTKSIKASGIDMGKYNHYFIGVYTDFFRFNPESIKADFAGKNIQNLSDLKAAIDEMEANKSLAEDDINNTSENTNTEQIYTSREDKMKSIEPFTDNKITITDRSDKEQNIDDIAEESTVNDDSTDIISQENIENDSKETVGKTLKEEYIEDFLDDISNETDPSVENEIDAEDKIEADDIPPENNNNSLPNNNPTVQKSNEGFITNNLKIDGYENYTDISEIIEQLSPAQSEKIMKYGEDALKLLISTVNDTGENIHITTDELAEMLGYVVSDYISNDLNPIINEMGQNIDTNSYVQKLFVNKPAEELVKNLTNDDLIVVKAEIIDLLKDAGLDSNAAKTLIPENLSDWITVFAASNPEQEYSIFTLSATLADAINESIQPETIINFIDEAEADMQRLVGYAEEITSVLVDAIRNEQSVSVDMIYDAMQQGGSDITKDEAAFCSVVSLQLLAQKSGFDNEVLSELLQKFSDGESVVFDTSICPVSRARTRAAAAANASELSDEEYVAFMNNVVKSGDGLGCNTSCTEDEMKVIQRYQYAQELRNKFPEVKAWINENGEWNERASREISSHMEPMEHLNYILLNGKNVGEVANKNETWSSETGVQNCLNPNLKVAKTLKNNNSNFSSILFRNAFKEDRKQAVKRFLADHPDLKQVLKENPELRPTNPTWWDGASNYDIYYNNDYYSQGQPGYNLVAEHGFVPKTSAGQNPGVSTAALMNNDGTVTYKGNTYTLQEFDNAIKNNQLDGYTPSEGPIGIFANSEDSFEQALKYQIEKTGIGQDVVVIGGINTVTTCEGGVLVTKHYDKTTGEFKGHSVTVPNSDIKMYFDKDGKLEAAYDQKTGEYLYTDGESHIMTFNEWINSLEKAPNNQTDIDTSDYTFTEDELNEKFGKDGINTRFGEPVKEETITVNNEDGSTTMQTVQTDKDGNKRVISEVIKVGNTVIEERENFYDGKGNLIGQNIVTNNGLAKSYVEYNLDGSVKSITETVTTRNSDGTETTRTTKNVGGNDYLLNETVKSGEKLLYTRQYTYDSNGGKQYDQVTTNKNDGSRLVTTTGINGTVNIEVYDADGKCTKSGSFYFNGVNINDYMEYNGSIDVNGFKTALINAGYETFDFACTNAQNVFADLLSAFENGTFQSWWKSVGLGSYGDGGTGLRTNDGANGYGYSGTYSGDTVVSHGGDAAGLNPITSSFGANSGGGSNGGYDWTNYGNNPGDRAGMTGNLSRSGPPDKNTINNEQNCL